MRRATVEDNQACVSCGHVESGELRQDGAQVVCPKCGERRAPPEAPSGVRKTAPLRTTFGCAYHTRIPKGVKRRYSLAGFVKFKCPACRALVTHRLATGSKLLYWLFALGVPIMVFKAIRDRASGLPVVTAPGGLAYLLFCVSVYALIRDQIIKHRLESQAG
jgi:predicted RNA-binding Zn-ribbon protein involved in translation (DUF1610 family)